MRTVKFRRVRAVRRDLLRHMIEVLILNLSECSIDLMPKEGGAARDGILGDVL